MLKAKSNPTHVGPLKAQRLPISKDIPACLAQKDKQEAVLTPTRQKASYLGVIIQLFSSRLVFKLCMPENEH